MESRIKPEHTFSIMSYNVLYNLSNWIPDRAEKVIQLVLQYMPDSVGFQEVTWEWLQILVKGLSEYYLCAPGQGSAAGIISDFDAIFYRKDKYRILTCESKWLSDTPEIVSRFPDSDKYRIFTYALLKRKVDDKIVVHINTHMENGPGPKQAKVLLNYIRDHFQEYPVYVTGDFNNQPDTPTIQTLTSDTLRSAADAAEESHKDITLHCWGRFDIVIDYIFIDSSKTKVTFYKVCKDQIDGVYPSDHHPIYAEFEI